jgi:hypothetical protein
MQENIFLPLEMTNTLIADNYKENINGHATSYKYWENGIGKSPLNSNNYGPTGVVSTAEDFVKWMRNFRTGEVGGPEVIKRIQQRGILFNGDTTYYAFGLGVSKVKGFTKLVHHGGMAGFASTMAYYPELDAGLVLLSNNKNILAGYFGSQILDFFFPELKIHQLPQKPISQRSSKDFTPEYLEQFVSKYTVIEGPARSYSPFFIKREGDRLFVNFKGQGRFALTPMRDGLFNVEKADSVFQIEFFKQKNRKTSDGSIITRSRSSFVKSERMKSPAALSRYVGRYYSLELETIYTVSENNGHLVISNNRTDDVTLEETDEKNVFAGIRGGQYWLMNEVRFLSDTSENITSCSISTGRTKNLLFI